MAQQQDQAKREQAQRDQMQRDQTQRDQQQRDQQQRERQDQAKQEAERREQSNNPATRHRREFGRENDAPGMHPANMPADRLPGNPEVTKGTRLDQEDVTGNPGHRGVNPDAPGFSINRGPNEPPTEQERQSVARSNLPVGSINEPPDVEPPPRSEQVGSINEPAGSQPYRGIDGDGENTKAAARLTGQTRGAPAPGGQGSQASVNEPPGSQIGSNMDPTTGQPIQGGEAPVLSGIDPESVPLQADGLGTFALTVTGEGFDQDCVIVFDDQDMETTFVSDTELRADAVPTDTAEGTVDVEVARGEELSEAITFDFTAAAGRSSGRKSQRKPSKGKRDKSKAKSKRR